MPNQTYASSWPLRRTTLAFTSRPLVMGILNVTPDSFSDGGHFASTQRAVDRALRIEDEGAAILDIGGESTRPFSDQVAIDEELQRVVPVLEKLQGRLKIPISIDTTKSQVARAAMELGAEIINDVSAMECDPQMVEVAVDYQPGICIMHMQGTPQTMQIDPSYQNPCEEIFTYLQQRCESLRQSGIEAQRICIDPGIGFGKTHEHNLILLKGVQRFHELGLPVLIGHSRKGLIAHLIQDKQANRDPGTVAISLAMALQGIQVLRVHDVAANVQALKVFEAVTKLG